MDYNDLVAVFAGEFFNYYNTFEEYQNTDCDYWSCDFRANHCPQDFDLDCWDEVDFRILALDAQDFLVAQSRRFLGI